MPIGRKPDPARQSAREAGAKRYQGAPCKAGHDGARYTSTGACVTCQARLKAKWHGRPVADEFEEMLK